MADELYKTLGVGKDAKPEEVRKAYRKKAKKAHPDAGGSREEFALISLAADVLSDADRRAAYDATGSVNEKPQDKSMSAVWQALEAVINECERRGLSPDSVDIVEDAKKSLRILIEKMDENKRGAERQLEKARKLSKRFRAKSGKTNMLLPLFEGRIRQLEEAVITAAADRPSLLKAIEILSDHTFNWTDDGGGNHYSTMNVSRIMGMASWP